MVEFLKHFKSKGIAFDYLSPINQPQWDWEKKSQEGTPATNANILKISKYLLSAISWIFYSCFLGGRGEIKKIKSLLTNSILLHN